MKLHCPHCGTFGTIRSMEVVTATVSRQYVICNNLECGHTWRATTEADLTLTPSATPGLVDHESSAPLEAADGGSPSSKQIDAEIADRFAARLRCAHCGKLGTVRSSEVVSATVSRQYVICANPECGHT